MTPDPYYRMEFEERRRQGMTRPCPDCDAQPGQECRNQWTGEPVRRFPVHPRRERDAPAAT